MKKLIVITPPTFFPNEAERINDLLEAGLERIHLRKPGSDRQAFLDLIKKIRPEFLKRVTLHDHLLIALEMGLGGVHLNQRNPAVPAGFKGLVSRSCHSLEEACHYKAACDYLFLSPIFDSLSKRGYHGQFTIGKLEEAKQKGIIDQKVFALGGLSAQTIPALQNLPFGGYALLGAIWGTTPETLTTEVLLGRYKNIKNELRNDIS